jgi:hypothetical protein
MSRVSRNPTPTRDETIAHSDDYAAAEIPGELVWVPGIPATEV